MTDVMVKAIDANSQYEGSVIAGVDKMGNIEKINPTINVVTDSGVVVGLLDDRMDDINYYTA